MAVYGTLLSGWRLRLTDNAGTPLTAGRISFYDASTSLPKAVYADRALSTALGTAVITDSTGLMPAVWLAPGLYKAVVQYKIQDLPEQWSLPLYDINHLGVDVPASVSGTSIIKMAVSVSELRDMAPGDADAVFVQGYYNVGDTGEFMQFVWNPAAVANDDGGYSIKPASQGAGTPGRWKQVLGKQIRIEQFGGVADGVTDCVGPFVNLKNYALTYASSPSVIAFLGSVYRFSGPITLDGTGIRYRIGNGTSFASTTGTGHTFTIQNPTEIDAVSNIVAHPCDVTFLPGSVERINPAWNSDFLSYSQKIERSCSTGIPVYVPAGQGTVTLADVAHFGGSKITIGTGTVLHSPTNVITVDADLVSEKPHEKCLTGRWSIRQGIVDAGNFGWGSLAGNNQASALQAAVDATEEFQIPIVIPPTVVVSHGLYTPVTVTGNPRVIRPEGLLFASTGGTISNILIDAPYSHGCLSTEGTGSIAVVNDTISPLWFYAKSGSQGTNANNLYQAMRCAWLSGAVLEGNGMTFGIQQKIPPLAVVGELRVRDLGISFHSSFVGYGLETTSGSIDFDRVRINANNAVRTDVTASLMGTRIRLSNCSFYGDVNVISDEYSIAFSTFSGMWMYGVQLSSAMYGGHVSHCTFNETQSRLSGDAAVKTFRNFPMLEGITFTNNTINNTFGTLYKGCIYLQAQAAGTLVSGIVVKGNTFTGHIDVDPSSNDAQRISQVLYGPGTWLNSATNPHYMIIDDNVLQSRGFSGYEAWQQPNIVASTRGKVWVDQSVTGSGNAAINYPMYWRNGVFFLLGNNAQSYDLLRAQVEYSYSNSNPFLGTAWSVTATSTIAPKADTAISGYVTWTGTNAVNSWAHVTIDYEIYNPRKVYF